MKKYTILILVILIAGLNSCKKDDEVSIVNPDIPPVRGGVVMSFDNRHVPEWHEAHVRLKDYNWKASFCISSYSRLSLNDIQKLHELADDGHEIAGRGVSHKDAVRTIDSLGVDEYLNTEIYPMIELMEMDGFTVKSFSYPFGSRNEETDELLLGIFDVLRGVGRGSNYTDAIRNCFFEGSPVVYAFQIDEKTPHFAGLDYEQTILDILTYARDNNKILLIFGQQTVENVTEAYQTSYSALELICNFVNENDMKFYTLSELKSMVIE
jgi:peptidoglycan-N-acetylglucosamine deacetylase